MRGSVEELLDVATDLLEDGQRLPDVRFLTSPESYQPIEEISPNEATIQNVRMMVERYLHFFSIYGSISLMPDTLWRF